MTGVSSESREILSPPMRVAGKIICVLLLAALLAAAVSVPFVYESQSIKYKTGFNKTLLRTGKVIGMIAATLLLLQIVLSARIKLLDRIFSLNRLYIYHRINAVAVALLATVHPLFIFAPEDVTTIPLELEYWPEVVGALLLVLILLITATALWRRFLDFSFHRWWTAHRAAAFCSVVMLILHTLYASETFEIREPRTIIYGTACLYGFVLVWIKTKPFRLRRKGYRVHSIEKAGQNAYAVIVKPDTGKRLSYLPGQFAFLTFHSRNVSSEEHPFTLSSSPTRPESLEVSIGCSGDWTGAVGRLAAGDRVTLDGPYGQFSHVIAAESRDLVMIAGGIGVTPMLSMLRYLADRRDARDVTLIWSNRTEDDVVHSDELQVLEKSIPGLRVRHVFTRQPGGKGSRLTRDSLDALVSDPDRQAAVFVCGPPPMMKEMKKALAEMGYARSSIHLEEFNL